MTKEDKLIFVILICLFISIGIFDIYFKWELFNPVTLIIYGVVIFFILAIIFFSISVFASLIKVKQIDNSQLTIEEKENRIEEIMVPTLLGKKGPDKRYNRIIRYTAILSYSLMFCGIVLSILRYFIKD